MSNQALTWAFGLSLGSAAQKSVLLYLADRAQEDGSCAWPSVMRIRVATELSERTVRAALKALQERGLIVPGDQRHAALGKGGTVIPRNRRSKVWDLRLNMPIDAFDGVESAAAVEQRLRDEEWAKRGERRPEPSADAATTPAEGLGTGDETLGCSSCTPENENDGPDPLGCSSRTSRGAAPAPKPKTKPNYPSASTRHLPADGETPGKEGGDDAAVDADARSVADALMGMRSKLGLPAPEPTARDLRHASRLLDQVAAEHGGDRAQALGAVLDVIGWMPRNRFWLRRILNARLLDSQWRGILNDFAVDRLDAASGRDGGRTDDAGTVPAQTAKRHRHTWLCRHVLDRLGATREAVSADDALGARAFAVADELNRRDGLPVLDRGPQPAVPDAERRRLDEARRAHGGSMFAGAAGYVPGPADDGIGAEP